MKSLEKSSHVPILKYTSSDMYFYKIKLKQIYTSKLINEKVMNHKLYSLAVVLNKIDIEQL